ncbi:MAG: hypothetical protein R6U32_02960 [Candidatus Woesearchaeota archaeon]
MPNQSSNNIRPYWMRNPRELSDYVGKVEDSIKRGDTESAAQLLGYRNLAGFNKSGGVPRCRNKIRKAEGLERARAQGKYEGPDYTERINSLADRLYEADKKA